MEPITIRFLVHCTGWSLKDVAVAVGVTDGAVTKGIHSRDDYRGWQTVRPFIAELVGIPMHALWPRTDEERAETRRWLVMPLLDLITHVRSHGQRIPKETHG